MKPAVKHTKAKVREARPEADSFTPFLPNLCGSQSIFLLVLVAELMALLLTISRGGLQNFNWNLLAIISMQILWIVLLGAYVLCRLRHWLARQSQWRAGMSSYLIVLLISLIMSFLGQWALALSSGGNDRIDIWQLANNVAIAAILAGILLRYLYFQQQLRNQQQAETQARIQALQSRIRPHFLFNSMNSIASLIATAPDTAERVVEDLSELFRASLAEPSLIPLARELKLCRHYLDIEQLRLGRRLKVEWQIGPFNEALKIPSLMLQPLMENAIFHGIEPLPKGGTVTMKVAQNDKHLSIVIVNPYALVKRQAAIADQQSRHNRMALDNIRRRLQAHYGAAGRLSSSAENGVFTTYIVCPLNT
jgi:two-component system, LytTR family, sensor histidine kinase AlgZ